MIGELDVFPHNLAAGSPLIVGDLLFIVTANGVDEGHINIPAPHAPSFIAVDKKTGKLLWEDNSPPARTSCTASGRTRPTRVIKRQAAGDLPRRRRLALLLRAQDRQAALEVRLQPEGRRVRARRHAAPATTSSPRRSSTTTRSTSASARTPSTARASATCGASTPATARRRHRQGAWSGTAAARTSTARSRPWRSPDGIVYASDLSGHLYCLDAKTGQHFWTLRRLRRHLGLALRRRRQGLPRRRGRRRRGAAGGQEEGAPARDQPGQLGLHHAGGHGRGPLHHDPRDALRDRRRARRGSRRRRRRRRPRRRRGDHRGRPTGARPGGRGRERPRRPRRRGAPRLDAHVRETWPGTSRPETGSPFWLERARGARLRSARRRSTATTTSKLFGHFEDSWLRGGPVRRWMPRGLAGRPVYVFETGGTTGVPKSRVNIEDFQIDYERVQRRAARRGLPARAPTG